ncbi:MAG TPA: hypothetical protein VI542_26740, partial [Candidatus Tectomicrobia bacterium]
MPLRGLPHTLEAQVKGCQSTASLCTVRVRGADKIRHACPPVLRPPRSGSATAQTGSAEGSEPA